MRPSRDAVLLLALAASCLRTSRAWTPGPGFAALDAALLRDLAEAYDTHLPSACAAASGATSVSFDFPGTNAASEWNAPFVPREEALFQAIMNHDDGPGGDNSWSVRIGSGGNVYSHYSPDLHGEAMPPQNRDDSPWADEVQQSVSVNLHLNNNPEYFVHQAGAYQGDADTQEEAFFSPSLARHCEGNSCYFASWGTQAHVPTPFTSPIMYINKYTNCGNGVIERTLMIHK